MPIRCYKYEAHPASKADADLLTTQLRLAGNYRYELVSIENRQRALLRSLYSTPMRDVPIADRKAWRDANPDVLKAWTKSDEYQAHRAAISAAAGVAGRAARAAAVALGLHYGTYWTVEEAVATSARTTEWKDDLGHRTHAKVGAPIDASAKPSTTVLADSSMTRFTIGTDLYALGDRINGYRVRATGISVNLGGRVRPARLREAAIRVGSDARAPIWAKLHVLMHRPLPEGLVTGAWAQRKYVGGRAEWELVISVDLAAVQPTLALAPAEKTCGVDIGWRRREDGCRVAYWYGDDGREGEVVIPESVEGRRGKSDDLRSIRDLRQNTMIETLARWRDENPNTWIGEALAHVRLWKRMGHFYRLADRWQHDRIENDEDVYDCFTEWLKKDRHLHAWEANNLVRMQRQIRGRLTEWAHDLCRRYDLIVVEDMNIADLKELPDVARINARSIQRLAPAEVRVALRAAAPRHGSVIQEAKTADTTRRCTSCGHLRTFEDPSVILLACDSCGEIEDQDRTAARNLVSAALRDEGGRPIDKSRIVKAKKMAPRRTRKRKVEEGTGPVTGVIASG